MPFNVFAAAVLTKHLEGQALLGGSVRDPLWFSQQTRKLAGTVQGEDAPGIPVVGLDVTPERGWAPLHVNSMIMKQRDICLNSK